MRNRLILKFATAFLIVVIFAVVRAFEDVLFYDPFTAFFKSEFTDKPLPSYDAILLYVTLSIRYAINSMLSLVLIYVIFKQRDVVTLSAVLFFMFLVLLIFALAIVLAFFPENKMAIFYIRRFLIQPILLLIFIPGFYFQTRNEKKAEDNFLND